MPRPVRNRHRQHQVLLQEPVLEAGQKVGRVVQACGENNYEVETEQGEIQLYQLPKRLRHVAFIKRGSYVFIRDDDTRGPGKVCGDIETVILDSFVSALRKEPFWPAMFSSEVEGDESNLETRTTPNVGGRNPDHEQPSGDETAKAAEYHDGSENEHDTFWSIGIGNPNRGKWDNLVVAGNSDDSSEN